jgi:CheY-like chemotaxis protein
METKILLVDDDQDFLDATRMLLEARGYAVIAALTGEEGYQKAKAEKPALILLDVIMTHDSEGFDTARKLNEDPATNKIPVIMITGIRSTLNLPFPLKPDEDWLPVKAILEKPVKADELLRHVKEAAG